MYKIQFSQKALEHFQFWEKTDYRIALKISSLVEDVLRDPFRGIGKPEPLKHKYSGCWSRRISQKDRLIYQIEPDGKTITILTCRGHYGDK